MRIISFDLAWRWIKPNCPKCLLCDRKTKRRGTPRYPYWKCKVHGKISTSILVDHLTSQTDPKQAIEYRLLITELQERLTKIDEENKRLRRELAKPKTPIETMNETRLVVTK